MDRLNRDRNIVAAICYVPIVTIVISIVVFFVEQEDKFIRFHALQAFLFSISYYLLIIVLGSIPFIGDIVSVILFLAALGFWIFAMVNTYNGRFFKLPLIGYFAERHVN